MKIMKEVNQVLTENGTSILLEANGVMKDIRNMPLDRNGAIDDFANLLRLKVLLAENELQREFVMKLWREGIKSHKDLVAVKQAIEIRRNSIAPLNNGKLKTYITDPYAKMEYDTCNILLSMLDKLIGRS